MSAESRGEGLAWRLDPRTKIVAMVAACISSSIYRDAMWGSVLFACALTLVCIAGKPRAAFKFLTGYVAILALVSLTTLFSPDIGARVALILQSLRAAFPALLLATLLVTTTKIGDLIAALTTFKLPRAIIMPLAVGIRFFPTFAEEFRFVSDAAKLQGLGLGMAVVSHPAALFEAYLVPVMLRSAKIAEELAAAAVARGIERPGERTSFNRLAFAPADICTMAAFCAACAVILIVRALVQGGVL